MKRLVLAGAGMAALWTAAAQSQPTGPNPSNYDARPAQTPFQKQQQDYARQQAEQRARDEAKYQADLQKMTPAAAAQYEAMMRQQADQLLANPELAKMAKQIQSDLQTYQGNMEATVLDTDAFNAGRAEGMSNQEFGQNAAHGAVNFGTGNIALQRQIIENARPLLRDMAQRNARLAEAREQFILQSNPNLSQRERDQLAYDTFRARNAEKNIDSRLDQVNFKLKGQEATLREKEGILADRLTKQAETQGRDMSKWTPPTNARPPSTRPPATTPSPNTNPAAQPPGPPSAQPQQPPASTSSGVSKTSSGKKGTVPSSDPYAAFRVPKSQGGTGSETAGSQAALDAKRRQQADAQARAEAQARADAMAKRIEKHRQDAMNKARNDNQNQPIDPTKIPKTKIPPLPPEADPKGKSQKGDAMKDNPDAVLGMPNLRDPKPGGKGGDRVKAPGGAGGDGNGGGDIFDDLMKNYRPGKAGLIGDLEDQYSEGDGLEDIRDMYPDGLPQLEQPELDFWQTFELGSAITVAELEPIYEGWDPMTAPLGSSGRSLSSAGNSPSSAGNSLSSAGNSLSSVGNSFSSAGTSLSSVGNSLSSAGGMGPSKVTVTPSSAPTGFWIDWGGYTRPSDPYKIDNTGPSRPGRPSYDGFDEPVLCGQ